MFAGELKSQALMHVRHKVKRSVEYKIDRRFNNINALEDHLRELIDDIKPRAIYENLCREFHNYIATDDYENVLKVFNQKSMVPESNVATLCGFDNKDKYINYILGILKSNGEDAEIIKKGIKKCFGLEV